jgi:uncharacterized Zn finger protein
MIDTVKTEPFEAEIDCPECGSEEVFVQHTYYTCEGCGWIRKCMAQDISRIFQRVRFW